MNYFSILLGFISSIGLYRLFFSLNRPEAKWRSVILLVICIFKVPLIFFWKDLYMGYDIIPVYVSFLFMIYELLALLAIVLLGTNRGCALVSAAFFFCIINIIEYPVVFLIGAVVRPELSILNYMEELIKNPGIYYLFIFIINFLLMCFCLIAAYWLGKAKIDPNRKWAVLFFAIYFSIVLIFFIWARDIITIISVSFLATALFTALFVIMMLMIFYFFIRFCKKETITPDSNNFNYSRFIEKLSRRELDVIEAVLAGYVSQKELAQSLNISVNTVKTHLKHIYQITGISSVDALALLFHGYVPAHPKITPKSP